MKIQRKRPRYSGSCMAIVDYINYMLSTNATALAALLFVRTWHSAHQRCIHHACRRAKRRDKPTHPVTGLCSPTWKCISLKNTYSNYFLSVCRAGRVRYNDDVLYLLSYERYWQRRCRSSRRLCACTFGWSRRIAWTRCVCWLSEARSYYGNGSLAGTRCRCWC